MVPTIKEAAEAIRSRRLSPVELTQTCLTQIEKKNAALNAFITVTAETALAQARQAEEEIFGGHWRGPLHGVPIALKDNIDTAGVLTTAASNLFRDRVPAEDADVVRRLKSAGAVLLGKTNLHEFAYGGSSVISAFGPIRNPWSVDYITGGSSGGSAAAVAAGMCCAAIGTDTAGSIREPAAYCGVVGLKPTYGRVSNRGVVPLSWSLDHTGPITQTVEDAALLLEAIAGYDPRDPASADVPAHTWSQGLSSAAQLRVGFPRAYFFDDLDPAVAASMNEVLRVLRGMVAGIRDVSLDVPTDRALQAAESFRYHARWSEETPELYQPETLRRIRSGSGTSEPTFTAKLEDWEEARRRVLNVFAVVDVLVTPTMPVPPPRIADLLEHPEELRHRELVLLRNTRPWNVWGLPAISVPCGFTEDGLPLGLQIAAAPWREDQVLALAYAYEQATAWHKRPLPGG
jgi:aspartyl-tRNA(Asn)/glutamyl-tRNA(Gln) amidotransferase subunit A